MRPTPSLLLALAALLCFAAAAGRVTASAAVRRGLVDAELVDATTDAGEGEADTRVAADAADASDAVDAAVAATDAVVAHSSNVKGSRQNVLDASMGTAALRARITRRHQSRWGGHSGSAPSDGSIHWLRENTRTRHGYNPLPVLVASTVGAFPAVGAVNGFNVNPPAALLTAQQATWWSDAAAAGMRAFVLHANAKAYFAGVAVGAHAAPIAPAAYARLANCHPLVIAALAGAAATAAAADARLAGWAGGIACDTRAVGGVQRDYTFVKAVVTADAAMRAYQFNGAAMNANAMDHLAIAYPAIAADAAQAARDWTYFDSWWYGTSHGGVGAGGYRLESAFGRVEDYVSSNARNPTKVSREYVRRDAHVPGANPAFGKYAGAVADDAGHVRANQFGGEREPINFVPESPLTNQVLFRKCENLATWTANRCPASTVNMYLFYNYAAAGLRPTTIHTMIKVETAPCVMAGGYGTVPLNAVLFEATVMNT